jgi:hypothetical protein
MRLFLPIFPGGEEFPDCQENPDFPKILENSLNASDEQLNASDGLSDASEEICSFLSFS